MTEKDLESFKMDQGKKRRRTHRFDEVTERSRRAGNDRFLSKETAEADGKTNEGT